MIKQVQVIRTKTLIDGTPRVEIDLLNGRGKDIGEMTDLIGREVTMIICPTELLVEEITSVTKMLEEQYRKQEVVEE